MRNVMCAAGLLVLLAGCASVLDTRPTASRFPMTAEGRGRQIAEYRCAGCHSIDLVTASPRAAAPPFRQLRIRFNALTWERTVAQIGKGGHDEMPPVKLDIDEVRNLEAYIETLR